MPPALPLAVAPGANALVHVVYAPGQDGPDVGHLTIDSSDPNVPSVTVDLGGNGVSSKISVTPPALMFGDVRTGQTSTLDVTIANPGPQTLAVSGPALTGSAAFSLSMPPSVPFALAPGGSAVLHVVYGPSQDGPDAGELTIDSNDPNS